MLDGSASTRDDDGLELADMNAAEQEAVRAAAEIGRDILPKRRVSELWVRVRDEHGQMILAVAVSMTIHWMDRTPPKGAAISHDPGMEQGSGEAAAAAPRTEQGVLPRRGGNSE
ncbi:MAG: hypothetical protein ICV68_16265 [Pyrinomonadaceae bacterium]|nr:hypothetical protein [Pyrinomonadaceae bacterium]